MVTERLFFQIAVGLIPILIFGAAATSLKPAELLRKGSPSQRLIAIAIAVLIVAFALLAEIVAIDVALSDELPPSWQITVVTFAVAWGTGLLGVATLKPWFDQLRDEGPERLVRRFAGYGVSLVTIVLALSTHTLAESVTQSLVKEQLAQAECVDRLLDEEGDEVDRLLLEMNRVLSRLQALESRPDADKRLVRLQIESVRSELDIVEYTFNLAFRTYKRHVRQFSEGRRPASC